MCEEKRGKDCDRETEFGALYWSSNLIASHFVLELLEKGLSEPIPI